MGLFYIKFNFAYLIMLRFTVCWDINNAMGLREVILERKRENKNPQAK